MDSTSQNGTHSNSRVSCGRHSSTGDPATGACGRPSTPSTKLPHETNGGAVPNFVRDALVVIRHIAQTSDPSQAVVAINKIANSTITDYDYVQHRSP